MFRKQVSFVTKWWLTAATSRSMLLGAYFVAAKDLVLPQVSWLRLLLARVNAIGLLSAFEAAMQLTTWSWGM